MTSPPDNVAVRSTVRQRMLNPKFSVWAAATGAACGSGALSVMATVDELCTLADNFGDLSDELLVPEPLMHYLRYNVRLNADELCDMGLPEFGSRVSDYYDLSCAEHRRDMLKIGRAAALRQIRPDHFPKAFDLA